MSAVSDRRAQFAPVTLGSPRFRSVRAGGFRVTEAVFPACSLVPRHAHEHTVLSVVLTGGFALDFDHRTHDCTAGTAFVEPQGEHHADRIGADGAQVLVIEVDPRTEEELADPCARLLAEPRTFVTSEVRGVAGAICRALRSTTASAPLGLEPLLLDLFATASRILPGAPPADSGPWLVRVRDMLHANLSAPPCVAAIAREVGVHRVHLGRAFRIRFGTTIGEYHRRLRVAWAAEQLSRGRVPIGEIALQAGFADHSHFTRVFKGMMGVTPEAYRLMRGERRT